MLTHVLNSILSPTSISQDFVGCTSKITTTCKKCYFSFDSEDINLILSVPVCSSVEASVSHHLTEESIVGSPCAVCNGNEGWYRKTVIVSCGEFFIVQFKRFGNNLVKLDSNVLCIDQIARDPSVGDLSVPINCDDVHFSTKFRLCATINHSCTLACGHYWCYIRDPRDNKWYSCDDEIVKPVTPNILNNSSSYLFFYERI